MFTECLLYARHYAGHLGHSGEWDLSFSLHHTSNQPPSPISFPNECESHSVMSDSLRPHGVYSPWNSPGQNTGLGSLSLLQGNLSNTGIEPRPPSLQVDSLPVEPQGKPSFPKFLLNLSPPPCFLSLGWWPCFSYLGNCFSLLTGLTPFNIPV